MPILNELSSPTVRDEYWCVYNAKSPLVSRALARAMTAEVEALWELPAEIVGGTRQEYESDDQVEGVYASQHWALKPNEWHDDYLYNPAGTYAGVLALAPTLIEFFGDVELAVGEERREFVVNRLAPFQHFGRHQDAIPGTVIALNLAGSGWVSIDDPSRTRKRFRTRPGEGFILKNAADDDSRPFHNVRAQRVGRLSLAI